MTDNDRKAAEAREARARRAAQRQGLELRKARTRDPHAPDYGRYWLDKLTTHGNRRPVTGRAGVTLDEIEQHLSGES
jgi:hypothetical protein